MRAGRRRARAPRSGVDRHAERSRGARRHCGGRERAERRLRDALATSPASSASATSPCTVRATRATMQANPTYDDVVGEISRVSARASPSEARRGWRDAALARPGHRIRQDGRAQPDPARPPAIASSSWRSGFDAGVLIGTSRKGFLGRLGPRSPRRRRAPRGLARDGGVGHARKVSVWCACTTSRDDVQLRDLLVPPDRGRAGVRGKWAAGIEPRGFTWVYKGILAVSERPGRIDHRAPPGPTRRGAALAEAPGVRPRHLDPAGDAEHERVLRTRADGEPLRAARRTPAARSARGLLPGHGPLHGEQHHRCCLHSDEVSDRLLGVVAGYLVWSQKVATVPASIALVERLFKRSIGPDGRSVLFDLPEDVT